MKFLTEFDEQSSQNNLESLQQLQEEHDKNMQEVYQSIPEKPKKANPLHLNIQLRKHIMEIQKLMKMQKLPKSMIWKMELEMS